MSTDIELLPCPFCGGKASMRHNYHWWVECVSCGADTPDSAPMDEDGAAAAWNTRANVAHATAAKDAEIERLRAEVTRLVGDAMQAQAEAKEFKGAGEVYKARAERLAEALRLIATPQRSDGTWNRDREACRQIAENALRDHDQEGDHEQND